MTPLLAGLAAVSGLCLLLACGVPVAVSLGLTGFAGMWHALGWAPALSVLQTLPYTVTANYAWAVLPLFVLMGTFAADSGLTRDLFEAASAWFGRVRGGLYMAVIAGAACFSAASGSTVVTAVMFTRIALPRLIEQRHDRSLSLGTICASGTFAAMIPPSLTLTLYAIITEQSIGRLLLAGVVPGLLSALLYLILIAVLVRLRPSVAPEPPKARPKISTGAVRSCVEVALLALLVVGGIYSGLFAPSAAGAVGAAGTLVVAVGRRGVKPFEIYSSLKTAAGVSAVIFLILIGGLIFSRFLVLSGTITWITGAVAARVHSTGGLLLLLCAAYLVMGCAMDTASIMVITLPFVFPLTQRYGIDPVWFGILFVKLIEIALITPPVGLNLYAGISGAQGAADLADVVKGVLPFLAVDILTLALLVAVPELSTWLPDRISF